MPKQDQDDKVVERAIVTSIQKTPNEKKATKETVSENLQDLRIEFQALSFEYKDKHFLEWFKALKNPLSEDTDIIKFYEEVEQLHQHLVSFNQKFTQFVLKWYKKLTNQKLPKEIRDGRMLSISIKNLTNHILITTTPQVRQQFKEEYAEINQSERMSMALGIFDSFLNTDAAKLQDPELHPIQCLQAQGLGYTFLKQKNSATPWVFIRSDLYHDYTTLKNHAEILKKCPNYDRNQLENELDMFLKTAIFCSILDKKSQEKEIQSGMKLLSKITDKFACRIEELTITVSYKLLTRNIRSILALDDCPKAKS